jgi:hypothetical protein
MMIHLLDAPLTDRTVVSSIRLDAATLWALEDHLKQFFSYFL